MILDENFGSYQNQAMKRSKLRFHKQNMINSQRAIVIGAIGFTMIEKGSIMISEIQIKSIQTCSYFERSEVSEDEFGDIWMRRILAFKRRKIRLQSFRSLKI